MAHEELKQLYLFRALSAEELELIDKRALLCDYDADERIFGENDQADALYVVKSGTVEVRHKVENGEEILISSLSAGSHFGEMGFLEQGRRSADAVCVKKAKVIQLHYDDLTDICAHHPLISARIHRAMAQFLASRLRMTTKKFSTAKEASYLLF
jgi:CRP-like cAMP-binding protein